MKVQDELSITVSNGSLAPLFGLPPVTILIQIFVQNLLPAGGVWEHHHSRASVEDEQQADVSLCGYLSHP